MKRFFVFLLLLCIVLCTFNLPQSTEFANSYSGEYCFYTSQKFLSPLTKTVQNGNGFIVKCDISQAKYVKKQLDKQLLFGESFSFCGNEEDINNIMFNLGVIYKTNNNLDIIAYSPKIDYQVFVDNKLYNVQIAKNKDVISVGFPSIYAGF